MPERRGERRSHAKTFALALALAAPIASTPFAVRALVDHLASAAGAGLASLSEPLDPRSARERQAPQEPPLQPSPFGLEPSNDERALEDALPPLEHAAHGARSPSLPSERARVNAPNRRGILVRADVVARAVRSGARPSGAAIAASGMRPSGVALQGVSAFGAGLVDGDIVTAVGGTTTTSPAMIVAAVAGAVRSGARAISAVVWRDEQEIRVTVEIPRLTRRAREGDAP